jgi:hypothetical protein
LPFRSRGPRRAAPDTRGRPRVTLRDPLLPRSDLYRVCLSARAPLLLDLATQDRVPFDANGVTVPRAGSSRRGCTWNFPCDLLPRYMNLYVSLVYQVYTGCVFRLPPSPLWLLFYVARGIFLRRRRPPGLARQGRAAGAASGWGDGRVIVFFSMF